MAEPAHQSKKTIRQLRQEWGWSQEVLAGRLQVSSTTIARWERGKLVPQPANQQRLADLFGVSVEHPRVSPRYLSNLPRPVG